MALLTDDPDFGTDYLKTHLGGNGDYYITIVHEDEYGIKHSHDVRIAMSGGNAPTAVKLAVSKLYKALEEENLNKYPQD